MTRVELLVYDLSNGMAASMSEAILGQRIDGIWHTGVLVFNREYFFGGGIQSLPAGMFVAMNGIRPCQTLLIGETDKSQQDLEAYLQSINHLYTQETYDLINHNCNNFSDTVVRFLTGTGIPSHIIDLPQRVFSTPGGALLRPMIEGMQNNIRQQSGIPSGGAIPGGTLDPFARSAVPPAFRETVSTQSVSSNAISSSNVTSTGAGGGATQTAVPAFIAQEKPLASADRNERTTRAQLSRILSSEEVVISTEEREDIERAVDILLSPDTQLKDNIFPNKAFCTLCRIMTTVPSLQVSCLFVIRLMALCSQGIDATDVRPRMRAILLSVCSVAGVANCDTVPAPRSTPAIVLAFCAVANFLCHREGCVVLFQGEEGEATVGMCVDAAMWGVCHEKAEVRQISSALAYNLTLASTHWRQATAGTALRWRGIHVESTLGPGDDDVQVDGDLHPHLVQLLCGTMESLSDESDQVSLRRRMLTAYRACRAGGDQAKELSIALGFDSVICDMRTTSDKKLHDDDIHLCTLLESFISGQQSS
mmetsp:Transcript_12259/g.18571  ORF Transcript_12259/g.18571 Transcript_12259/m.18571 type:complete len:535 (-) Transcript_12259:28-1632(-)